MHSNHCESHKSHHGKLSYLENPARKDELSPDKLLNMIPIKETDTVLDFGAGTGYFTIPAAKAVTGNVYALDIDAEMLKIIEAKARQENVKNIVPVFSDGVEIPLEKESIDVAIASLVLHEIHPLNQTLAEIRAVLKPDGYLVCIELEPKGESHRKAPRISSTGMEQEMKDAGLRIVDKITPSESLYVLIAQKC